MKHGYNIKHGATRSYCGLLLLKIVITIKAPIIRKTMIIIINAITLGLPYKYITRMIVHAAKFD